MTDRQKTIEGHKTIDRQREERWTKKRDLDNNGRWCQVCDFEDIM